MGGGNQSYGSLASLSEMPSVSVIRIELMSSPPRTECLNHLGYTLLVPVERIELPYSGSKPDALPLSDTGIAGGQRVEL